MNCRWKNKNSVKMTIESSEKLTDPKERMKVAEKFSNHLQEMWNAIKST